MQEVFREKIISSFRNHYKSEPAILAYAPGRIEILGNHTDYNEGYVLSAATDLYTAFAVSRTDSDKCSVHSFDIDKSSEFIVNETSSKKQKEWVNYIKGVVHELNQLSSLKKGFKAGIMSEVPLSAGMSSSAALEVSACFALGKLYNIKLDNKDWARLGQRVENNYMGLKSGLLDQFSSIYGKKDKLIMCDFRTVEVLKTVEFTHDYVFVIVNSMVKHNLVDSDYNARRESCERSVAGIRKKFPQVKMLRDVTPGMLHQAKDFVDFTDYKRAMHIVGENERVLKGVEALIHGRIDEFGQLLYESHESSKSNFENSCPELDYLVDLSKSIPGCIGARLSGGGFGGISIHLVKKDMAQQYRQRISTAFKIQTGIEPQTIICSVGDGAGIIK